MHAVLVTIVFGGLMTSGCNAQPVQESTSAGTEAVPATEESKTPVVKTAAEYLAALDRNLANGGYHFFDVQLPDGEKDLVVAELRKRFPFQSIRDRLEPVEQPQRLEQLARLQRERETVETATESGEETSLRWAGQRPMALAELHSDAARDFIISPGFGHERMPRLSPYELERRRGPVVLNTQYHSAAEFASEEEIALGTSGTTAGGNSFAMPGAGTINALHETTGYYFADREQLGLVRSPDEVAGFTGHAVDVMWNDELGLHLHAGSPQPVPGEGAATERWHLNRVELVGLLASDEFRVYVSEHLPAMDELKDVPTRRLDDFELAALPRLLQGETTHTSATPNRIRMLGALRASAQCLECHSVREGDLLGALSYELVRTPKVEVSEVTDKGE
jgi:hypothetical protein